MKSDAELVGTTVSGMTEFQSVDSNNCYKIFHYDDNTSSELFDNYTDSNSTGAPERNSWKEPSNRSNESMWYDFGHNSLVDIRKSNSYHEGDVNYEQNLYTYDLETSNSNKLTSNKRFNEDELVNPSKIFKSEYVSSSCESVHSSPMEHETKYIQRKMKLYPSESKNTVNLTHYRADCKTKMSTNENMHKTGPNQMIIQLKK
ncbi:hypothetical protein WA026_021666 [Henosepilachna vigintioctopunctata]|uniref:Uncharacterized protein n=1 Tax=Henosepilachna vigintioctopunctata TaxID=420089 RepID=A0AAW1UEQ6_9CUCU